MGDAVHVVVVESDIAASGFIVEWWLVPATGAGVFRIGTSSEWGSVVRWVQRSGFAGTMIVRHGGRSI